MTKSLSLPKFNVKPDNLRKPGFWLKEVMAHPCCWIPLATGGSVQLFGTHNAALELAAGAAIIIAAEEARRVLRRTFNRSVKCGCDEEHNRFTSYSIAAPIFLATYFMAHAFIPGIHADNHQHSHEFSPTHIEECQRLENLPDFTPDYHRERLEQHIETHHGTCPEPEI